MKKLSKILAVLFAVMLAVSVFAFAADVEADKSYVVFLKDDVLLFSEESESPRYMVVDGETLNSLLEKAPEMIDCYEEKMGGSLCWNVYDGEVYTEKDKYGIHKYELDVISAAAAWDKGYKGDGIRVAVIDTGIDTDHPELKDAIVEGRDYTNTSIKDTHSHGTRVSGMIAAAHNDIDIKGIAPDVEIVPLKISKNGEIDATLVDQAIRDAVKDFECDVVNLSFHVAGDKKTVRDAINYAVGENVTVVAAAGNYEHTGEVDLSKEYMEETDTLVIHKDDSLFYPATYDNVIGVGSVHRAYGFTESAERVSPFSKQNESVFIAAPGERVITTTINNDLGFDYGTSVAAPLVTGAVALLKQANPELTPAEIMDILKESATDDVKGDGYDKAYGYGILNVAAAIELAEGKAMLAPENITYRVTVEDEIPSTAVTVENYTIGNIGSHPLDTPFTAKAEPEVTVGNDTYKFAYWANGNGTHVSGKAECTFIATSNFTLCAVYDKVTANVEETTEKTVEFWNGNGVLLGTKTANGEGKIASTEIPEKDAKMTGFTFAGWLDDENKEFSAESVLKKNFTRVVAQFKDKETTYSITFDDESDTTENGVYGKKVEYTATGEGFAYWMLGDKIVSYDKEIEIALWGANKTLTAVYDKENVIAKPTVVLDEGADDADFLIYAVPEDYEIVDAGIVFGKSGEKPRVASFRSKASVKELPENDFGQFTSLPGDTTHTVARGYLIYKDTNKVIRVIYSD